MSSGMPASQVRLDLRFEEEAARLTLQDNGPRL